MAVPDETILASAELHVALPPGHQLNEPIVPGAMEDFKRVTFRYELSISDGGRERLVQLLLSLLVPGFQDSFVGPRLGRVVSA